MNIAALLRLTTREYLCDVRMCCVCKLNVWLRYSALTFRNFVPRLELLTLFRDFRKSLKMCKTNHFSLFLQIMFDSIWNLSWRSDFMMHHHIFRDFLCKIGIFGNFFLCKIWIFCSWDFWSRICESAFAVANVGLILVFNILCCVVICVRHGSLSLMLPCAWI